MRGLLNNDIKCYIKKNLKKYNDEYSEIDNTRFTISRLDEIFRLNRQTRKESKKTCIPHLDKHLSISNILVACIFTLTCSIYSEEKQNCILPEKWISLNGKPNPNMVFGFLLTQLTQFSISLTELTEKGLDNSARIILRSIIELTWQILILLYYRDDLIQYVKPESLGEVNRTWWELFGKGRIQNKLEKIEMNLDLSNSSRNSLAKERKEAYHFFSESVHHGFINIVVSSIVWDFEKDSGAWSALGGTSARSNDTIISFNRSVLYFIDMFIYILNEFHGTYFVELPKSNWKDTLILRDCAMELMANKIG